MDNGHSLIMAKLCQNSEKNDIKQPALHTAVNTEKNDALNAKIEPARTCQ